MTSHDPKDPAGEQRDTADAPHAPGGGTPLHTIPDEDADRVAPRDPSETAARDPGTAAPGHDGPDQAGNRPGPL